MSVSIKNILGIVAAGVVWLASCGHVVAECAVPRQASTRLSFNERLAAKTDAPFLIAHRGCQSLAPENTLASFVCAARLGLDAIETDVRLTKDGKMVCVHDASLKRMFGIKKKVSDMTADELREFVPTNGNCISAWPKEMLRIPTLLNTWMSARNTTRCRS